MICASFALGPARTALFLSLGATLALSACASRRVVKDLVSSQKVPSAEGSLKVAREKNGNTLMRLSVAHLAPPSRLTPGASTYVVWARPMGTGEVAHNVGGLRVDDALRGDLEALVPFASFDLFVTPEPSRGVLSPSGEPVLWTTVVGRAAE